MDASPPAVSRRTLLAAAVAGSGALLLPAAARAATSDEYVPALVIGSGFGGAVTALRLGQAGVRTVVLERGQRWPKSPWGASFSSEQLPDGRAFWFKTTAHFLSSLADTPILAPQAGVMDYSNAGGMDVYRAAAVGGGSVVYSGVCLLPARVYFEQLFPKQISYDAIVSRYAPRVRKMLRFSVVPPDLYQSLTWRHARVWDKQANAAGFSSSPVDSVFNWTVCRQELGVQSRPSAVIGESNFGNANGAKYDLTQNYIPAAEATGNVTVRPLTIVTDVSVDRDRRYVVSTKEINKRGVVLANRTYVTDRLFLCAGSMATSELLVRARDTGALPRLNDEVGAGWGTNGDTLAFRSVNGLTGVAQAAPCPSAFHTTEMGVPTTSESWFIPHPLESTSLVTLGMAVDTEHRGSFRYDAATDSVSLGWDTAWDEELIEAHRRINAKIATANNVIAGIPGLRPEVVGNFTAHPLGGAVLGRATDFFGRVRGYPGLYVNDGALLPGSNGGANPSLMIASLAERNIEHIVTADL